MRTNIIDKICNELDDPLDGYSGTMLEYIESKLNHDNELYKYMSLEGGYGFLEDIIRDNTIKYGAPNEFNDPFECMSRIGVSNLDTVRESLNQITGINYATGAVLRAYDEIVNYSLNSYRSTELAKYGILCLSSIWEDILMWAHYADDHRGIVAVFQFNKNNSFYDSMRPVNYVKGVTYFELEHANHKLKGPDKSQHTFAQNDGHSYLLHYKAALASFILLFSHLHQRALR